MYSLPRQSVAEGLDDLHKALAYQPEHLSWYQLTIEPNTVFYKKRPPLPNEEEACTLEEQGLALLATNHFKRYEISAFCQQEKFAKHNLNYWLFGDYYGIGAGAHGKISLGQEIYRTRKQRQPTDYLALDKAFLVERELVTPDSLLFEFMLNTTRVEEAIPQSLFSERTGLPFNHLHPFLVHAASKGLVTMNEHFLASYPIGTPLY